MTENPISDALKMVPYGLYVVTSRDGEDRNAMVLNWFTQVSFEAQHVVIGLQRTSYTYGLIEKSKKFVVNILRKEDEETLKAFTKSREKNPEKFEGADTSDAPVTGVPVLTDAAAYLECEVVSFYDTGAGHDVVIAKVVGGRGTKRRKGRQHTDTAGFRLELRGIIRISYIEISIRQMYTKNERNHALVLFNFV